MYLLRSDILDGADILPVTTPKRVTRRHQLGKNLYFLVQSFSLKNEIDISQMYWYFFVVPIFIFYHNFKFLTFFKPKYM